MKNKQDFLKLAKLLRLKETLRDQLKYFKDYDIENLTDDDDFMGFVSSNDNDIPIDKNNYIDFEKLEKDGRKK